ncbi:MAG: acetate--CoA ligase family protein [Lautropia sp.]|nr:acetate--CoA ligase family protein [Lautropia sp.]
MTSTFDTPAGRLNMARMLRPGSVAIVGASASPGALGNSLLKNLVRNGFAGDIHLINPRRTDIEGRACLPSVADLPEGVDVAVLAIPQPAVLETVKGLAARGVGSVVIFSAGFAEAGESGLAQQQEIAEIARRHAMVIEGPNCLGCINYIDGVPLTFVEVERASRAPTGEAGGNDAIGIVSQSGAMMTVLCTTLASRQLPLSYAVSTGNEAASHAEDYVEFLLDDPDTRVIVMMVEHFRHPKRMLAAAHRARRAGKTVVLLHPGKSLAARESAATHTGAMAGDHALMRTKLARAGVVFAETLEELGDMAELAMRCPQLPSPGVAILGESGAFKALSLDLAESLGMKLPVVDERSASGLRSAMPPFVAVSNPIDLTAQGLVDPGLYERVLRALLEDERFSTVIIGLIQGDPVTVGIKMPPLLRAMREARAGKPVIVAGLDEGANVPAHFIAEMRALGIPYFPSAERAFRAVQRFCVASDRDVSVTEAPALCLDLPVGREAVPEYEAKACLAQAGIQFSAGRFVTTVDAAVEAAQQVGYPVALKAQSAQLGHKSDAGGVALNIGDEAALRQAWQGMLERIRAHDPRMVLEGVLVEEMAAKGLELIIGAKVDPAWGPVILVGLGGVTAEVIQDVRLLDADLTVSQILAELDQLKSAPLFHGFRGSEALDMPAVAALISSLGQVLRGTPGIREIDLNPVVVYPAGQGVVALDALMLLGEQGA